MPVIFSTKKAFTLIEILIIIGVLTVLFGFILFVVNPLRQLQMANDARRRSDVNLILNAVGEYMADSKGGLPPAITTSPEIIGNGFGQADLCSSLVPKYIADLPYDPKLGATDAGGNCTTATSYSTGYSISVSSSDGRITVSAAPEVPGTTISITR